MTKVVIAFSGSAEDLQAIATSSATNVEVIAVAFDFGGGALRERHDQAIAAGASRCHVLDVREEFAREHVWPTIQADAASVDDDDTMGLLARRFAARKLAEIARIERASSTIVMPDLARHVMRPSIRCADAIDRSARIEIGFEHGVPVLLNGISMTLTELFDSLATLAAAHRVGGVRPAVRILRAAYSEVSQRGDLPTGSARLELFDGQLRTGTAYATT